jgi:dihydrofolate reductase
MTPRPQCSVFIAVSLDGYIARPDGRLDWLDGVQMPGEDYGYAAFYASVDALIMGRGTWDVCRAFPEWPYSGKRVIVLTNRPEPASHGEELVCGDVGPVLAKLQRDGVRRIYVDGGVVIRQFLAAGLIDDLTIAVVPRILGDGIRLFDRGMPEVGLELVSQKAWPTGLVQLNYAIG